jgi:TorA maturation chaperone TorD
MNKRQEYLEIILTNRSYLYQLLQAAFGTEPTKELFCQITSTHTQKAIELFYGSGIPEVTIFLALLKQTAAELSEHPEICINHLTDEYTRIFYGPDTLPAPPWESVFTTGQQVLFQEKTLSVRKVYVQHGYLPKGYPNEADDHLAYELDFMFRLASQTQDCVASGQFTEAKVTIEAQQRFLKEHLLRWVGKFAERLCECDRQFFYPHCALFLAFYLSADFETLSWLAWEL